LKNPGFILLIGILLSVLPFTLSAQEANVPKEAYQLEDINRKEIRENRWKQATRGLDYTQKERTPRGPNTSIGGDGRKAVIILSILAGAALLAFVIAYLLGYIQFDKKNEKKQIQISVEEVEDRLLEADLRTLIREALEREDFKSAIRLYYLLCLKELSLSGLIRWKKQKTNHSYLAELRSSPLGPDFRSLTLIFDRIWYGAAKLDQKTYESLAPQYEQFLNRIQALSLSKTSGA
jgi:hypothetical protein